MSDEAPTTNQVREAAATDGYVHRIEPTAFDRWLAWKCAETLRDAARGNESGTITRRWLFDRADRIEARGAL